MIKFRSSIAAVWAAGVLLATGVQPSVAAEKAVTVGGAPIPASKTMIETAANSKDHTAQITARSKAGLLEVVARFEWTLQSRFPKMRQRKVEVPALKSSSGEVLSPATSYSYSVIDYDTSSCYANPESHVRDSRCASHPWLITFSAKESPNATYLWNVEGGTCKGNASPKIQCRFAKLGTYRVTLQVSDGPLVATRTEYITPKDYLIVSLGDSVASGEGVPEFERQVAVRQSIYGIPVPRIAEPGWEDEQCHRSALAGPALAAKRIEDADPHTSVTFVHLACSGATILAGLLGPYQGQEGNANELIRCTKIVSGRNACADIDTAHYCNFGFCFPMLPPQVDHLARLLCGIDLMGKDFNGRVRTNFLACSAANGGRDIDVLMLSVGANDLRFGDIVKGCMILQNCHLRDRNDDWPNDVNDLVSAIKGVGDAIQTLASPYTGPTPNPVGSYVPYGSYAALGFAIHRKLTVSSSNVLITEYFDPTRNGAGAFCEHALRNTQEIAEEELGSWLGATVSDFLDTKIDYDGLNTGELRWAYNNLITPLNQTIAAAASRQQWQYVSGIGAAFATHGVCSDDNWVNGLKGSIEKQGDLDGTMHPNRAGHVAYAERIFEAMRTVLR